MVYLVAKGRLRGGEMFVKTSWSTYKGKRSVQYHLAEAYRDKETGKPRHRMLVNLTSLPEHAIDAVRQSLRTGCCVAGLDDVKVSTGDSVRGAGLLAAYRAWKQVKMDTVLSFLSDADRQSMLLMVLQRILDPGSKLSLERRFADTLLAKALPRNRFDADDLYDVMDAVHDNFYEVQERLAAQRQAVPTLCLYDITSTFFEGTEADDGEYGHSRDKRWDRYQIVIGLVCDEKGLPLPMRLTTVTCQQCFRARPQLPRAPKPFRHRKSRVCG